MGNSQQVARVMVLQDPGWLEELWLRFWANGGSAGIFEFDAFLHGLRDPDVFEVEILDYAVDDLSCRFLASIPTLARW
ncbi:hypothetical protein J7I84_10745 [Arthrobacter sp. ISL-85]|uniref:hypothetical protein n=1 Tax=Arthrobacter sp. ISL-85 TaxID=2819115 RepID=UPI001BE5F9A1|nr:hypothetical protein [Arthrobacter sp. ISL-85]MBT2566962.1 hypothetical protein [Arthrobacter sp. ISL-85]